MSLHHHRGAVADENSVNWTLRQETGKRVVVTRNHRKLAPLGFCAKKVHAAHSLPRRGRGRVEGGRLLRLEGERLRILRITEGIPYPRLVHNIFRFVRPMQLPARPSAGHRPNSARAGGVSVFFQNRSSANPSRRTPHGEEPCSLPGSVDSGESKHPQ